MSRRRPRRGNTVSLFPFLSVLSCVIGTLTLMITAIALGELVKSPTDNVDIYDKLQNKKMKATAHLAELRESIDDIQSQRKETDDCLAELETLQSRHDQIDSIHRHNIETLIGTNRLRAKHDQITNELTDLKEIVDQTKRQAAEQNRLDNAKQITLLPSGSGRRLQPHFVECDADKLVLYSGLSGIGVTVARSELEHNPVLKNYLNRVRYDSRNTLIFLIRPNGIPLYKEASTLAGDREVKSGKLPLTGDGDIDFSLFERVVY